MSAAGDGKAQKNILNVMLYIAFFPQLIAGPIVRYSDFADQINCRTESFDGWSGGCCRFALGLGKKVILSIILPMWRMRHFPPLGICRSCWLGWGRLHTHYRFIFDFSGYSDMAIGLGRMFGFRIRENFNYPYISRSVSEFWRRWHISGQLVPRLLVHPFGWQPCEKPWTACFQLCLWCGFLLAFGMVPIGHSLLGV